MSTTVIQTYESVFLGITGSIWIMLIEFLIIMGLAFVIVMLLYYSGPTFGYIKARWDKKQNVSLVLQNHNAEIKSMDYFAGIFKDLGLTWLQSKWENINFGICNLEIVADWAGWTMDAKKNAALKQFIDDWNAEFDERNPRDSEYEELYENDNNESNEPAAKPKQKIIDADTLYDAIDSCDPNSDIRIRAFCHVPIYELKQYWPKSLKASDMTGYLEAMKKVDQDKSSNPKAQNILLIIGIVVGAALGAGAVLLLK